MSKHKPVVVVTRKLPQVVETRMMELFQTKLNATDQAMGKAELIEAVKTADVLGADGDGPHRQGHSDAGGRAVEAHCQFWQRG